MSLWLVSVPLSDFYIRLHELPSWRSLPCRVPSTLGMEGRNPILYKHILFAQNATLGPLAFEQHCDRLGVSHPWSRRWLGSSSFYWDHMHVHLISSRRILYKWQYLIIESHALWGCTLVWPTDQCLHSLLLESARTCCY